MHISPTHMHTMGEFGECYGGEAGNGVDGLMVQEVPLACGALRGTAWG